MTSVIATDFALAIRPTGMILRIPADPLLHVMFSYRSFNHPITVSTYEGKDVRGSKRIAGTTLTSEQDFWVELERMGVQPVSQLRGKDTLYAQGLATRAELALTRTAADFEALQTAFLDKVVMVHKAVVAALQSTAGFESCSRGNPTPTFPQHKGLAYWVTRSKVMVPGMGHAFLTLRCLPGPLEGNNWHVEAELDTQSFVVLPQLQYAMKEAEIQLARVGLEITPSVLNGVSFRVG